MFRCHSNNSHSFKIETYQFSDGNLLKLINRGRYLVQHDDWAYQTNIPETFLEHPAAKL